MTEADPLDVCACGCNRNEHDEAGRCSYEHEPSPCTSFRLSCTAADMLDSMKECFAMMEDDAHD